MLNTLTVKPVRVDGGGSLVCFCFLVFVFVGGNLSVWLVVLVFWFVCVFVMKWKKNAWSEEKGVKRNLQHVGGGR